VNGPTNPADPTLPDADPDAEHLIDDYMTHATRVLRGIPDAERADILRELRSHLSDSIASRDLSTSRADRVRAATGHLGDPAEYLRPLIADHLLQRSARIATPWALAAGLYGQLFRGLRAGIVSVVFLTGYAVAIGFIVMGVFKVVFPTHIGLFVGSDGSPQFGIVGDEAGARELLGYWVVPLGLIGGAIPYAALTMLLRRAAAQLSRSTTQR